MDKRWKDVADILVNYSTEVQPGQRVMIAMRETETLPLARTVYESVIKAGGFPQIQFLSDYLDHSLLDYGTNEQISWLPEIEAYGMEWADVYIALRGAHNIHEFSTVSSDKLATYRKMMGKISSLRWENTRWCIIRVPNEHFAQQAETDVETIMDLFFNATIRDYEEESKKLSKIAEKLSRGSQIRLVGKDTDLSFSVEGRQWLVGTGKLNLPDGEIFTAPVNSTLNGHISFDLPGVLGGRLVHGIRLEWKNGALIHAEASKNESFLIKILESDPGAKLLGEFAIGTNPEIDIFCKDIFFDEKIGGTVHVALGRAYPACGGSNQSAIHWDIIKDTRKEGSIYLDGKKIFQEGNFTI
jgi:aminopeptidase